VSASHNLPSHNRSLHTMFRPGHFSECEAGGELETAGTEFGHDRSRGAEVGIGNCGPELVGGVAGVYDGARLCDGGRADVVLHVVDYGLLEVGVIEEVEGFGAESQLVALSQMEDSRHTEIDILEGGTAEGVELFSGDDGEVDFRIVEDGGVGAATGQGEDAAEFEILEGVKLRSPNASSDEAVRLVELRRAALRGLVELVEVSGALVGCV